MTPWMDILVTGLGLAAVIALVVLSLRAGRVPRERRLPWVLAVIALSLSVAWRLVMITGALVAESFSIALPMVLGNLAVAGVLLAAFWRPRWAGWTLIGTAVVLPLLSWVLWLVIPGEKLSSIPPAVMAMTYGVPALVVGGLLLLSATPKRDHVPRIEDSALR